MLNRTNRNKGVFQRLRHNYFGCRSACLLMLGLLLCISGCGNQGDKQEEGYTFSDDLGREITVTSHERVAALLGSHADIWMLAGGEICATADDAWEDFHLDLSADTVNLGKTHAPDREGLFSANPDFVIASSKLSGHMELREALEGAGITVAYFDVSDFDDYLRLLKICTDITGNHEIYEQYGTKQQIGINEMLEQHKNQEPQSVLVMRASAASIRAKNSEGTMLGGMLKDFGCVNIADNDAMLLENLSVESILLQNPDKLFFVQTGNDMDEVKENVNQMFDENPLWYELDAVKNGQVYYMDKQLYNLKPNARFLEAYQKLEAILYE